MTDTNNTDNNKKLSSESKTLIRQLQTVATKATHLIPQLYDSLRKDGLQPFEARNYIEEMVSITRRQLTNILPDEAKHLEMTRPKAKAKSAEITSANQEPEEFDLDKVDEYIAKVPKQPNIPPPPQVVREAEIIPIGAPDEPLPIPTGDRKIMLDTAKFRSDLRIALINGAKVWLSYNNAKEVIKIDE